MMEIRSPLYSGRCARQRWGRAPSQGESKPPFAVAAAAERSSGVLSPPFCATGFGIFDLDFARLLEPLGRDSFFVTADIATSPFNC
jgi:hypothetical protein